MPWKPWQVHLFSLLIISLLAVAVLLTLIPYAARTFFSPRLRGYGGVRFELVYYLTVALIPIALWLVPAFVRHLAHIAYSVHKTMFGRSGFYIRYLAQTPLRFR